MRWVRGVRWATIEEGDANAHEEGDDDEAETSAEGVNESEPVNPSLWRHRQHGKCESDHRENAFATTFLIHYSSFKKHTHIRHQQETHQVEAKTQQAQEQGLVQRVPSELRKLVEHSGGDALHVAKLWGSRAEDIIYVGVDCIFASVNLTSVQPYQCIDSQHKEH